MALQLLVTYIDNIIEIIYFFIDPKYIRSYHCRKSCRALKIYLGIGIRVHEYMSCPVCDYHLCPKEYTFFPVPVLLSATRGTETPSSSAYTLFIARSSKKIQRILDII